MCNLSLNLFVASAFSFAVVITGAFIGNGEIRGSALARPRSKYSDCFSIERDTKLNSPFMSCC